MMKLREMIVLTAVLAGMTGFGATGVDARPKGNPQVTKAINDCIKKMRASPEVEKKKILAQGMGVSLSAVPRTFCTRVITAMASGRLKPSDMNGKSGKFEKVLKGG